MAYEVFNARVKQKLNTEAQWIAEEDTFGVIFEGEQAFVYDESGNAVNFKIGDGTKKFSELPYFIAFYTGVTSQKILSYINPATNITIAATFRNQSLLQDIILVNNSGSPITLKIGTTNGGNQLGQIIMPVGACAVGLKKYFTDAETVYFTGLTGVAFSLFVLYFQLDEAPVIPPTSTGTFAFPKYFQGSVSLFGGALASSLFNFADGLGKPGTGYDNCALAGTNGTQALDGKYLVGYKTGDTIGGDAGNAANGVLITRANLPAIGLGMFQDGVNSSAGTPGPTDKVARARSTSGTHVLDYEIVKSVGGVFVGKTENLGSAVEMNIQPDSIITLYFVAIS